MSRLSKAAARLALENPEIRDSLVPLLKKYAERPETTDIYPHKMDHGWTEPLAGGSDIMRRVQNQFRQEQGLPTRPDSEVVPKVARQGGKLPVSTDLRHPYYEMTDAVGLLQAAVQAEPNVRRDRKVQKALSALDTASAFLYRELNAHYLWD